MGRLFLKRLNSEDREGRLFYWVPWVMKGRLWGRASIFIGGSDGQPGVGSSTGNFERWLKGSLEMWRFSLRELHEGHLEGGLPC